MVVCISAGSPRGDSTLTPRGFCETQDSGEERERGCGRIRAG